MALSPAERSDERRLASQFAIACGLVWAALTALSLLRHHTFHSSLYDVGIFHQVLWNTAHGRPFESSIKHMNYLGDHFSPSFALLAPLEWLPRPIDLLLAAQAAAIAVTGWNTFQLARRHLSPRAALLVGLGTLLCPQLYCPALSDIHPEPFMAAAISRALLDLDSGSHAGAALWLLLALAGKEDAGLLIAPLGIVLALDGRTRRFGIAIAIVSILWMTLAMTVAMPALRPPARPGAAWFYLGRLSHLGSSPRSIARSVLLHPLHAFIASTSARKLLTIGMLVLPFALAPLRSWRLLAVLPFAAAHYVSARTAEFSFPFHYLVPTVPLIAWAAIDGAARDSRVRPLLWVALVAVSGLLAIVWRLDPVPLTRRANHAALAAAIHVVPDAEPVCVENWFGAHLAARREIEFCVLWEWERDQYRYYGWPDNSSKRWQIFDLGDSGSEHRSLQARLAALRSAGARVFFDRDGVVVVRVDEEILARTPPVETPPPPSPTFAR